MNRKFRNTDSINFKDFLKDLSKMPTAEVAKRYKTTQALCLRYAKEYGIETKRAFGRYREEANFSDYQNKGSNPPDLLESTCTVKPRYKKPPLNQTYLYR